MPSLRQNNVLSHYVPKYQSVPCSERAKQVLSTSRLYENSGVNNIQVNDIQVPRPYRKTYKRTFSGSYRREKPVSLECPQCDCSMGNTYNGNGYISPAWLPLLGKFAYTLFTVSNRKLRVHLAAGFRLE